MLDPEALTCLLVLLFIDEPKLNTTRLHRVLRNLCYHGPTRAWLIRALLSIVQRAGDSNVATSATNSLCLEGIGSENFKDKGKGKKSIISASLGQALSTSASSSGSVDTSLSMHSDSSLAVASSMSSHELQPAAAASAIQWAASNSGSWLSISLEAALGCRANVFQIHRTSGKKLNISSPASISVHPQAAPLVCRHSLDTLISLAKVFPTYFLPAAKVKEVNKCDEASKEDDSSDATKRSFTTATVASLHASAKPTRTPDISGAGLLPTRHEFKPENDFWNILVRLDSASGKSKGKGKHNLSTV
jgi:E3 ubiquitin-protein ligase HUWE1